MKLDHFVDYWAFNYEIGSSPENYSALLYKMSSDIYGNEPAFSDYYFAQSNGFRKIVDHFHRESGLMNGDHITSIRFNEPVVEIRCQHSTVEVVTKSGNI